jgi:hypothetical protein
MHTLRAMRLVAVSVVKNEADIIEAFVRHTRAWTDHHLVFDHDSSDGTREILRALQAEGLPLTLFSDDQLGNLQQARSNHLTRLALDRFAADWICPLDADEFVSGPSRPALEQALQQCGPDQAVTLPLLDYCTTDQDDPTETNPAMRLRYSRPHLSPTRKIFVPRQLAADPAVLAGKGSHALYRHNEALPGSPLPEGWHLAHLALRSPQHQALRVMLAELQKLSRGHAAAGLDVHYRLGYQLLAEDPALFFKTLSPPVSSLRLRPIAYAGGALRYTSPQAWSRVARAMLPYLEQLARSHGTLLDAVGVAAVGASSTESRITEIEPAEPSPTTGSGRSEPFAGFTAVSGWGLPEGPVPEAFLPPFHWGYAPTTILAVESKAQGRGQLVAELLTYSDHQTIEVVLNDTSLHLLEFSRTNQREHLIVTLPLLAGHNRLHLNYSRALHSEHDPRALAAIYLRLRVTGPGSS